MVFENDGAAAAEDSVSRGVKVFIVLLALLQGGLLYLARAGGAYGWSLFAEIGGRVGWYTAVLALPAVMMLTVTRLDDGRFWQHVGMAAVFCALVAGWAIWSVTGAPGITEQAVLWPFGMAVSIALFVALPYLQARQGSGRWQAAYTDLFAYAWQNALTLALTGVFVGLCWLVLWLWASLFRLTGISYFSDLFSAEPFVYMATGFMAGLGILIARLQRRVLAVTRQILFAICLGLLPLLAAVMIGFLSTLPFTGLDVLWDTRSAAATLAALMVFFIVFLNAVFQDGEQGRPYPLLLRGVVEVACIVLPIFALIALYALWLRIGQYGWSAPRLYAVLIMAVLFGYALGYALSVVRRYVRNRRGGQAWLPGVRRVNVVMSLVVIGLVVLTHSPVNDPYRAAVASQTKRLDDGRINAGQMDIKTLRFDNGRRGYRAVQALRDVPAFAEDRHRLADLDRVIAQKRRWLTSPPGGESARKLADIDALREQIERAEGTPAPDNDWLEALLDEKLNAGNCLFENAGCVLVEKDLDGSGRPERLLCDAGLNIRIRCEISQQTAAGEWRNAGRVEWHFFRGDENEARRRLLRGEIEVMPRPWPDLKLEGVQAAVITGPCCTDEEDGGDEEE